MVLSWFIRSNWFEKMVQHPLWPLPGGVGLKGPWALLELQCLLCQERCHPTWPWSHPIWRSCASCIFLDFSHKHPYQGAVTVQLENSKMEGWWTFWVFPIEFMEFYRYKRKCNMFDRSSGWTDFLQTFTTQNQIWNIIIRQWHFQQPEGKFSNWDNLPISNEKKHG